MKVLADLEVSGKRVLVRADLDVPLQGIENRVKGIETEQATRLVNLAPTVDWLLTHGAKQIMIAGHINRPSYAKASEGKLPGYDPKLSTMQLLPTLERILGKKVAFNPNVILSGSEESLRSFGKPQDDMREQKLTLFENLRFWPGEMTNDTEFAKQLASMADVYVNEAFGNCHRSHASMVSLPALFPDVEDPEGRRPRRAAGLHLEKEVEVLSKLLKNPARPFVAIVGGVKIETKVPVIENLAKIADFVLVGGEIARNVDQLSDSSQSVDQSVSLETDKPKTDNTKVIIATLTDDGKDISNESIHQFKEEIAKAKTIVWNGPMGVFEEGLDKGTTEIAQAVIDSGAYSVVGGGETTQFLGKLGMLAKFGFISSGGGAMLAFLAGNELPGLAALA